MTKSKKSIWFSIATAIAVVGVAVAAVCIYFFGLGKASSAIFAIGEGSGNIEISTSYSIKEKQTIDTQKQFSIKENEKVTVVAVPAEGFTFLNYTDADGNVLSTDATYKFTFKKEIKTVRANFVATKFTITFDYADASIKGDASKIVEYKQTIGVLPQPIKEGYLFAGWVYNDGTNNIVLNEDTVYTYTQNITLHAKFNLAINMVLNIDAGVDLIEDDKVIITEKDGVKTFSILVADGVKVSGLPTAVKSNFVFNGWSLNGKVIKNGDVLKVEELGDNPVVSPLLYKNIKIKFVGPDQNDKNISIGEEKDFYLTEENYNKAITANVLIDDPAVKFENDSININSDEGYNKIKGYTFANWTIGDSKINLKEVNFNESNYKFVNGICIISTNYQLKEYAITYNDVFECGEDSDLFTPFMEKGKIEGINSINYFSTFKGLRYLRRWGWTLTGWEYTSTGENGTNTSTLIKDSSVLNFIPEDANGNELNTLTLNAKWEKNSAKFVVNFLGQGAGSEVKGGICVNGKKIVDDVKPAIGTNRDKFITGDNIETIIKAAAGLNYFPMMSDAKDIYGNPAKARYIIGYYVDLGRNIKNLSQTKPVGATEDTIYWDKLYEMAISNSESVRNNIKNFDGEDKLLLPSLDDFIDRMGEKQGKEQFGYCTIYVIFATLENNNQPDPPTEK